MRSLITMLALSNSGNTDLAISRAKVYFAAYDGTPKTYADIEPLIDELFDENFCIVGPDGTVVADRAQVKESHTRFLANEALIENLKLEAVGDDKVDYQLDLTLKGQDTVHAHSVAYCKDGMFLKSVVVEEGVNVDTYNTIFGSAKN